MSVVQEWMECPKCGTPGEASISWAAENQCPYVSDPGHETCSPDEHLHVRCGRCGYFKARPCADAPAILVPVGTEVLR